uniref:Uncharacterized protein n=1 Tax=Glyptapanteles indiensis TaxID=92994 RepID=B7S959_GLYIN|nr:conserved hypothetical protein [Glyptapanteles indiensis]
MSIHSVTKYVNLTDTIVVPAEWPAYAFQKLLVPLVEQVINAAGTGKPVVLQVLNTPAKLVKRHDRNRIQYFFEKVFAEELMGSYVFEVIFDKNDKNIKVMNDVTGPEPLDPNALERQVSSNDYNVLVDRSKLRTSFYLIPTAQRETNREVMILLAIVAIPPLLFLFLLMDIFINQSTGDKNTAWA